MTKHQALRNYQRNQSCGRSESECLKYWLVNIKTKTEFTETTAAINDNTTQNFENGHSVLRPAMRQHKNPVTT